LNALCTTVITYGLINSPTIWQPTDQASIGL
jgi:hypothetical protein